MSLSSRRKGLLGPVTREKKKKKKKKKSVSWVDGWRDVHFVSNLVYGSGFRIQDSGFRVQSLGCRVWGLGFWGSAFGLPGMANGMVGIGEVLLKGVDCRQAHSLICTKPPPCTRHNRKTPRCTRHDRQTLAHSC